MNPTQVSQTHMHWKPGKIEALHAGKHYAMDQVDALLPMIGMGFSRGAFDRMYDAFCAGFAMDNFQSSLTSASVPTPLQFLQNWLPGFVAMLTASRKIDDLIGMTVIGSWGDEQIVQQTLELTGSPVPYGDLGVVPLADWNPNYVQRNLVRFEQGMRVGRLEEYRAAAVKIDSAGQKRASCGMQLEIQRNAIGFYGYNSGNNLTYGFLTDPNLLAYVTVATGGTSGSKLWSLKTFLEKQADIITAMQTLRNQSADTIDPQKTPLVLACPTNSVDYLRQTNDFGISIMSWLKDAYPNVRVESAPQLNNANGGANVFYLFAESVNDGLSTDDGRVFLQAVPSKFQLLGTAQQSKGYEEDYSNATAGVIAKRPYAVYRATGI